MNHQVPFLKNEFLHPSWSLAACVDIETTGLYPEQHEIVELAIALFAFENNTGQIKGIVDMYVGQEEPSEEIPGHITAIHGLTKSMLKGNSLNRSRIKAIAEAAEFYVAHNARFDSSFCISLLPQKPWHCTMTQIRWVNWTTRYQSLDSLIKRFRLAPKQYHRAEKDVKAILMLLSQKNEQGQYYLGELLQTDLTQY